MRLEELTPSHVRRAVAIYMRHAWPDPARARPRFDPALLEGLETMEQVFALCETPRGDPSERTAASYALRLGNEHYAFMKFVIQEYLVDREYFFSVDTHDEHFDLAADDPDRGAWAELRAKNRALKRAIEEEWAGVDLPTSKELRSLAEGIARLERSEAKRARILFVDDEADVCRGLGALLAARGYDVELAYDGEAVLERLARDPLPDLVVLDFSMPGLDGAQVLARIRDDPRLAQVPVLMATASSIDLARVPRAAGLLRKPYPREVLFAMIERLLANGG